MRRVVFGMLMNTNASLDELRHGSSGSRSSAYLGATLFIGLIQMMFASHTRINMDFVSSSHLQWGWTMAGNEDVIQPRWEVTLHACAGAALFIRFFDFMYRCSSTRSVGMR
jgi:hypothetical protein